MYQAGIRKITLHENKGISFVYYDSQNEKAITDLTSQGQIIVIENNQLPEFNIKMKLGEGGELINDYEIKFHLLGYDYDNLSLVSLIESSIYGWVFDIEYYDGTHKFYNTPLKCRGSEIDPQKEMSFQLTLKSSVSSNVLHLDYDPDVNTIPVYRADTTLLTADTTIYTADYAL